MAEHATVALDDRRLVVELQSLGVRVEDETGGGVQGRRGGAGPSDAGFLWVRGLPLTVPMHAEYAQRSPYTLRIGERGARLELAGEYVAPVVVPPRPKIYDMHTADGVPYWKIALLHLDSIASTVVQKCIYWDTPEQPLRAMLGVTAARVYGLDLDELTAIAGRIDSPTIKELREPVFEAPAGVNSFAFRKNGWWD